jgi:saccharopine dehydrogenase-like NADP-dependent oxidoreductase
MIAIVIGMGRMGTAVSKLLDARYDVFHSDTLAEVQKLVGWRALASSGATIFACVPYTALPEIAQYAVKVGANYVDLTEDIDTREYIRKIAPADLLFISGTGLAPGYINMVAGHLARRVEKPQSVVMLCGALPQDSVCNALGYQISWSPAGLVREYTAPCEVKENGTVIKVAALSCKHTVRCAPLWPELEAFCTSGGAGTTPHTFDAPNVIYQTLRYNGHLDALRPLLASANPEQAIHRGCGYLTDPDVVYIYVQVWGPNGEVEHAEIIYPQAGLTAIQYATARGAIETWEAAVKQGRTGFVRPEEL